MKWVLLLTAVILELIYLLLFILTIKLPGFRFWPPPSAWSWQFIFAWLMVGVVALCGVWLGFLDLDSGVLPNFRIRLPITGVLVVMAAAIGGWGNITLRSKGTLGLGDRLVTSGAYHYTRNPQYIGDCLSIIGFMVLVNSWMVGVIGILGLVLTILAPFTEEPWLEERFGDSYSEYKRSVPRFLGKRKEHRAEFHK